MRYALVLAALVALSGCGGADDAANSTPSVLVTTATARQGSRPAIVTAYGTASPAIDGVQTISFAQPGQVTALKVMAGQQVRAGQVLLTFVPAASARAAYTQALDAEAAAAAAQKATAVLFARQLATTDQMAQATRALADARSAAAALAAEGATAASHSVTAPFAGTVATIAVTTGDRTQPDAPLLTLARAGEMVAAVGIDPAEAAGVVPGQPVTLRRLNGGVAVFGHVRRIAAALDEKTRMIAAEIAYPAGALLPGEAVRAEIATHDVAGWLVPHASVVFADGPVHVFQDFGGVARAVPVTVELAGEGAGSDVVTGAIDAARPVIVAGAYQVQPGDHLRRGQ